MTIRPLHDRVVIRPVEADKLSSGGIVIPDTAAEKPARGEVVAVGDGAVLDSGKTRALSVAVGDHVLFGKYSGTEVEIDGEKLLVIRESDILGVIDEPAKLEKVA